MPRPRSLTLNRCRSPSIATSSLACVMSKTRPGCAVIWPTRRANPVASSRIILPTTPDKWRSSGRIRSKRPSSERVSFTGSDSQCEGTSRYVRSMLSPGRLYWVTHFQLGSGIPKRSSAFRKSGACLGVATQSRCSRATACPMTLRDLRISTSVALRGSSLVRPARPSGSASWPLFSSSCRRASARNVGGVPIAMTKPIIPAIRVATRI